MGLKIENLFVDIAKNQILKNISFCIEKGEFISIIGSSGCGKTTLLKAIAGLLDIKSGNIYYDNASILHLAPKDRDIVIVFQDLRLFPHLNVYENIAFGLKIKKVSKNEINKIVYDLLEKLELKGYENRKISELSGGQAQRVALARAIALRPRVLLLDEPFSSLDEKLRINMGELVKHLHKIYDLSIIMVTHDKSEALKLSDKIVFIKDGKIIQIDSVKNIYYQPKNIEVAKYFSEVVYLDDIFENQVYDKLILNYQLDKNKKYIVRTNDICIKTDNKSNYFISNISFLGLLCEIKIKNIDSDFSFVVLVNSDKKLDFDVLDRVKLDVAISKIISLDE